MEPSDGPEVGDQEALVAGGAMVCFLSQLTKVRVNAHATIERYTFIAGRSSPRPRAGRAASHVPFSKPRRGAGVGRTSPPEPGPAPPGEGDAGRARELQVYFIAVPPSLVWIS